MNLEHELAIQWLYALEKGTIEMDEEADGMLYLRTWHIVDDKMAPILYFAETKHDILQNIRKVVISINIDKIK